MRLSVGLFLLLTAIVADIVLSVTWDDIGRELGDDPYLYKADGDVGINIITTALKLRDGINDIVQPLMKLEQDSRREVDFQSLRKFFRTAASLVAMIDPNRGKIPVLENSESYRNAVMTYVDNMLTKKTCKLRGSWLSISLSNNILGALLHLLNEDNFRGANHQIGLSLETCPNIAICHNKLWEERREEDEARQERKRARARKVPNAISGMIPCWNCPTT